MVDGELMSGAWKELLVVIKENSASEEQRPLVSVVMPCLNEEEAIGECIQKIQRVFAQQNIDGEIVVADNGSSDKSVEIAEGMGVRVVHEPKKGYGSAYLKGFACARGQYLIMGDADDTYDFNLIPDFLRLLKDEGKDFVTGSRYMAGGDKNITLLHRYIGNPMLTFLLNILFGTAYSDVYCGFRGFSRLAYLKIKPVSPGMEFNLELAINAVLAGLKVAEIPIQLAPRKGESKLNTFKDGWRSLRMMLLYCPNKVFLYPGFGLASMGVFLHLVLVLGLAEYQGRQFGPATSIFATLFTVVGVQILSLGLHAKTYSWSRRFDQDNTLLAKFYSVFTLERGLMLGSFLIIGGAVLLLSKVSQWIGSNFAPVPNLQIVSLAAAMIMVGCNILFTSLFISAMSMTPTTKTEEP